MKRTKDAKRIITSIGLKAVATPEMMSSHR